MIADPTNPDEIRHAVRNLSEGERLDLMRRTTPRFPRPCPYIPHKPHPPQSVFLLTEGKEAFYGGAAGGGKSDALLMAALQYVDVPGYSALIIRRNFRDLTLPGAIMDRAKTWLRPTDAKELKGGAEWVFPSGAKLNFGYVFHHRDVEGYQGAEFQFIAMDELTYWEERTYSFLFSRLRKPDFLCRYCDTPLSRVGRSTVFTHRVIEGREPTTCERPDVDWDRIARSPDGLALADVPIRMRSASNPGGRGHGWVKERFVDPETRTPGTVFVPARLIDNPNLDAEDYAASMEHMGSVDRERLLRGDWDIVEESMMFKRHWFTVMDEAPVDIRWCRYWDLAATKVKRTGDDPDWTAGALLGLTPEGTWVLGDIARVRESPLEVERLIAGCAATDPDGVMIRMEETGAGDKHTVDHYTRKVLTGLDFKGDRPMGSKPVRARPVSSAVEAGNFAIVRGRWNKAFLDEAELFPEGEHDDQIDAVSGAFKCLTAELKAKGKVRTSSVAGRTIGSGRGRVLGQGSTSGGRRGGVAGRQIPTGRG